jgi:hypothetical protein
VPERRGSPLSHATVHIRAVHCKWQGGGTQMAERMHSSATVVFQSLQALRAKHVLARNAGAGHTHAYSCRRTRGKAGAMPKQKTLRNELLHIPVAPVPYWAACTPARRASCAVARYWTCRARPCHAQVVQQKFLREHPVHITSIKVLGKARLHFAPLMPYARGLLAQFHNLPGACLMRNSRQRNVGFLFELVLSNHFFSCGFRYRGLWSRELAH